MSTERIEATTLNKAITIEEDPCINNAYTINREYPYTITKKSTGHFVTASVDKDSGYVKVSINGNRESLHRLIALQWIPIPEHISMIPIDTLEVDNKNKVKSDYHIENLEWVTRSENAKNKTKYKDYTQSLISIMITMSFTIKRMTQNTEE